MNNEVFTLQYSTFVIPCLPAGRLVKYSKRVVKYVWQPFLLNNNKLGYYYKVKFINFAVEI